MTQSTLNCILYFRPKSSFCVLISDLHDLGPANIFGYANMNCNRLYWGYFLLDCVTAIWGGHSSGQPNDQSKLIQCVKFG